jgi:uncharacterized protein with HEPN domain
MRHDPRTYLQEVLGSALNIQNFTEDIDLEGYRADLMRRRAVEREFTILGEALTRLEQKHPTVAEQVAEIKSIRRFRNRLVHQYDVVDDELVFGIVRDNAPELIQQVRRIVSEAASDDSKPTPTDS